MKSYRYTQNLICPYCYHEDRDSWEYSDSEDEVTGVTCNSCGKDFFYKTYREVREFISVSKECVEGKHVEKHVVDNLYECDNCHKIWMK